MEPIAVDGWMLYSGHTSLEVQEVRQCHSDEVPIGHQTAIPSCQRPLSGDWCVPPYRESRQCQRDTIYRRCLFMNDEHMRWAEDLSGMDKEQGMGDVPAIQQAWHSRRHKGAILNYQMDMASFQMQLSIKSDGPGNREMRCHHGDIVHGGQLNMNNKHVEQLMNASGRAISVLKEGRNDIYMSYRGHEKLMEEKVSK
jgi:hypothetical protein